MENHTDFFPVQLLAAAFSSALRRNILITDSAVGSMPGISIGSVLDIDGLTLLMYLRGMSDGSFIRINVKPRLEKKTSFTVREHIVVEELKE